MGGPQSVCVPNRVQGQYFTLLCASIENEEENEAYEHQGANLGSNYQNEVVWVAS